MQNASNLNAIIGHYATNYPMRNILIAQLVNKGAISRVDLNTVFRTNVSAEACAPEVLAAVYRVIKTVENKRKLPDLEYFFTEKELYDSMTLTSRKTFEAFPITFENVQKISPQDEYTFVLTFQQIAELSCSKVLQIRTDMQRESEIIRYGDSEIPCVKFSEHKVKEISENIINGKQHPNMLRFHLIPDIVDEKSPSFVYDPNCNQLTIMKGLLATIDGNHRVNAIVDAIYSDHKIGHQCKMIICLSVGSPMIAREIIVQEEKRTPIDQEHIRSFQETEGSRIISRLKSDEEFMRCFKFCTTTAQCHAGGGLFIEYLFADAFIKYFEIKKAMRPTQLDKLSNYLSRFLQEYFYIVHEKYPSYYKEYNRHLQYTMSNEYTIYGLMYIAASLRDVPDWADQLEVIVHKLDFNKIVNPHYTDHEKQVINFIKNRL